MGLVAGQVSEFRREGVLFPMRALDADDAQLRAAALQAFAHDNGAPLTSLLRLKAHLRFRALEERARNPVNLDAVESLIDSPRRGVAMLKFCGSQSAATARFRL